MQSVLNHSDIKKICLIIIILLLANFSFSQENFKNDKKISRVKLLKYAKIAINHGDIFSASDNYKKYDELNPNNQKVHKSLAYLYWQEKNYAEAEKYFIKSYKNNPLKNKIELYYAAKCMQTLEKYEEAKNNFETFSRISRNDSKFKELSKQARLLADEIDKYSQDKENINIVITHLDSAVNNPHIDFSPLPYKDNKLIFGSLRQNEITYYSTFNDTMPVRKFYIAEKNNDKWKFLGEFDTVFNTEFYDVGNGALSFDKKRFYFTKCKQLDDKQIKTCEIYVSRLENNLWQKPERLPNKINAKTSTSTMPTLGVSRYNTDVLYFVSDREGSRGGMDLWFTYYNNETKSWEDVKNCGKEINTINDEITPYYDINTKNLYFSSDGKPGFGGFDIFKSFGEGKKFTPAENVGKPLNSSFDDVYYILGQTRENGFLSSNRYGENSLRNKNCCDDIYEFKNKEFRNIVAVGRVLGIKDSAFYYSIEKKYLKDLFLDLNNEEYKNKIEILYNYPVELYLKDSNKNEYFVKTEYTENGSYYFNIEKGPNYKIRVVDFNDIEKTLSFSTKQIFNSDTIRLDAIIINTLPQKSFIVENIYYDFGKYYLRNESKTIIDNTILKILQKFPKIIVEISSHTDSVGTEEKNLSLSQNRAQSVVDYLIKKGISPERLVAKGYGESKPIAPNTNPDGSDNPEGRQINRRTEFKIIGKLNAESEILFEYE